MVRGSCNRLIVLLVIISPIFFFNYSLDSTHLLDNIEDIELPFEENNKSKRRLAQVHPMFVGQRNSYRVLADPITIINNNDFTSAGFSGTGTQEDPYVLNDTLIISDGPQTGIYIQNTDAYFKIENVTISGTVTPPTNIDGIRLNNVANGLINNNNITFGDSGITLYYSQNNTISHNLVSNQNKYGITITAASHYNLVKENTVTENGEYGILVSSYLGSSMFNIVEKNTIKNDVNGIHIKGSNNTVIENSVMENDVGIQIYGGHNNTISNNLVADQIDYGIYLCATSSYNYVERNTISENNEYGIVITYYAGASNFNIIEKNTIINHTRGIRLWGVHNNSLIENTILNCSSYGIEIIAGSQNNIVIKNTLSDAPHGIRISYYLGACAFNFLEKNTVKNCETYGISLDGVYNNTVTLNSFFNNSGYGLYLSSESYNNTVNWNTFLHNNAGGPQAYDGGVRNSFAYNHWNDLLTPDDDNDGFVDVAYELGEKINPALLFDGVDDRIDTVDFALNNNFTIELWAYISDPGQTQYMIGKHDAGAINKVLFGTLNNQYDIYYNLGGAGYIIRIDYLYDQGWEHLALVGSANSTHTNVTFYRNGDVLDHRTLVGRLNDAPGISGLPWTIAHEYDPGPTPSDHFTGMLDEIRFLNKSLTAADIQADYFVGGNGYAVQSDTVAWYHFDENVGTSATDSSGNGNTGTIYGGASWISGLPRKNTALYFDGIDDYVDTTDFALKDNFTVELWTNPTSNTPAGDDYLVAKNFPITQNRFLIGIGERSGAGHYIVFINGIGWTTPGATTGWQHLAVVCVANNTHTNVTIYKNGAFLDQTTFATVLGDVTGGYAWSFGQEWDTSRSNYYQGKLDEIRFLNRSLTANEVNEDYLVGGGWYPVRSETVAWYHFEENTGTNTIDSSGNSNNGTITGASWDSGTPIYIIQDDFPRIAPIWINENSDLPYFADKGSGTQNDPYILDGFDFSCDTSDIVHIENTNAFFILRNSQLNGSPYVVGIRLVNTTNAVLANNSITYCDFGIFQSDSVNNTIIGNVIEGCNSYGICISTGENNSLISNRVTFNRYSGFKIQYSSNNLLESNDAEDNREGFYFSQCENQTLIWNKAYRNNVTGFYFSGTTNCTLINNTASQNTYGFYLYLNSKSNLLLNNEADRNEYCGFQISYYCDNNTLINNTATENQNLGFRVYQSNNNTFTDNIAQWNTQWGYLVFHSDFNILTTNKASDNGHVGFELMSSDHNYLEGNIARNSKEDGFALSSSRFNNLTENIAIDNIGVGIDLLYSYNNMIFSNIFLRNNETPQGYDLLEYNNIWSFNGQGNYWSDYSGNDSNNDGIGDTPYNITGNVIDPHPLFYAVHPSLSNLTIISDGNIVIEITDVDVIMTHDITWIPSTNLEPTNYVIYREHEVVETGYWFSEEQLLIPVDLTILEERKEYNYTLRVWDYSSNAATDSVMIAVRDTFPPELTNMTLLDFFIDEGEEKTISFTFRAMDDSLHLFKFYQDNVELASWTLLFNDYGEIDFERIAECWRPSTEEVTENIVVSLESLSVSSTSVNLVTTLTMDLSKLGGGTYNYNLTVQDYAGNIDWIVISVKIIGTSARDSPGWTTITVILAILSLIPIFSKRWRKKREEKNERRSE